MIFYVYDTRESTHRYVHACVTECRFCNNTRADGRTAVFKGAPPQSAAIIRTAHLFGSIVKVFLVVFIRSTF